jgi:peptidoglycan-associated lipoprotein
MRQIALGLGLAVAVLLWAGCPPAYPKCSSDEQCKEHKEVCVQGQCQECAVNENCPTGFVCQANKCVPKPECEKDTQCGEGKACKDGKCQAVEAPQKPEGVCSTNEDCPSGQQCQAGRCAEKPVVEKPCEWGPIHFPFNEATLTDDARTRLSELVECVKKEPGKVTLAGHADERGTEEYNLQLSNRRAVAVEKYLEDLGVPASKLGTIGYGETRPEDSGHDEAAWAKNRRVEIVR